MPGRGRFNVVRLPFRTIDVGPIDVRTLGPAEQALLEQEIKLSQGVSAARGGRRSPATVRAIAARFPDDPFALGAADRGRVAGRQPRRRRWPPPTGCSRSTPNHARALMPRASSRSPPCARPALDRRGGLGRGARSSLDPRRSARRPTIRSCSRPITTASPLQGVLPPEDAQNALYTAMELAPSDGELRYKLARDFERRNMIPEAIAIIRPSAYPAPASATTNRRASGGERERARGPRPPGRHRPPRNRAGDADPAARRGSPAAGRAPAAAAGHRRATRPSAPPSRARAASPCARARRHSRRACRRCGSRGGRG